MVMTVDEFLAADLPDGKSELVRGELRVTPPPGAPHGRAATNLVVLLSNYARQHRLGDVFSESCCYELTRLPRTVRAPDASFVRSGRLPADGVRPGPFRLAPDLAIEVLSPSTTASELEETLHDYTVAGTPLIWIVDPAWRSIMVVASDAPVKWLFEGDTLDGGTVIPGFACPVADVFEGIAR